jgi:hypothetical protein
VGRVQAGAFAYFALQSVGVPDELVWWHQDFQLPLTVDDRDARVVHTWNGSSPRLTQSPSAPYFLIHRPIAPLG